MLRKLICASAGLLALVSALLGVLGPARACCGRGFNMRRRGDLRTGHNRKPE